MEKAEETQQRGCKLQIIEERTLLASQSPEYNCKRKKSITGSTNLPSTYEASPLSTYNTSPCIIFKKFFTWIITKDATRKCTKDHSWHFTNIIFSPINIHRVHSFIPGTRYYLRRGNVFKLVLKNNLWLGTKLCFHIPPIYSSNVHE